MLSTYMNFDNIFLNRLIVIYCLVKKITTKQMNFDNNFDSIYVSSV